MNSRALFQKAYLSCKMGWNDFISSPWAELQKRDVRKLDEGDALKHICRTAKHGIENVWYQEFSSKMWVVMLHEKVIICGTYLRPLFSAQVNTAAYIPSSTDVTRGTFLQVSPVGSKGKLPKTLRWPF